MTQNLLQLVRLKFQSAKKMAVLIAADAVLKSLSLLDCCRDSCKAFLVMGTALSSRWGIGYFDFDSANLCDIHGSSDGRVLASRSDP